VYNEGIKLMALSTEMKKTLKFWAFANDILHTSGEEVDLHSLEVEIAEEVLNELNDQVGYFKSKNLSQYFASYSLSEAERSKVNLSFHHPGSIITDFGLVCNVGGLFAKFHLTYSDKKVSRNVYYFVKLINYP